MFWNNPMIYTFSGLVQFSNIMFLWLVTGLVNEDWFSTGSSNVKRDHSRALCSEIKRKERNSFQMKVCTSAPSILKFFVPTCGIGTPGFLLHTGFRLRGNPESSACDHNFTCINSARLYNIPEDFSVLLSGRHSAGSVEASCLHVCLANMPQTWPGGNKSVGGYTAQASHFLSALSLSWGCRQSW